MVSPISRSWTVPASISIKIHHPCGKLVERVIGAYRNFIEFLLPREIMCVEEISQVMTGDCFFQPD